jgi:general L-amino acid transport system permease protein
LIASRPHRSTKMHLSWSNAKVRGLAAQIMVVAFVGGILVWLGLNTAYNLQVRRIASGFAFMQRESGLPLAESLIPYSAADTYLRALLVGVLNTLKVAIVGIVLATILGTLLGIARLSRNWLLSKASAVYIEIVRDLPLLLQLLFWYAILQGLPGPAQSLNPLAGVYLSNRALKLPVIVWQPAIGWGLLAALAGLVLAALLVRWGHARHMQDGRTRAVWPLGLTLILVPPAVVWSSLGAPLAIDWPVLRGFNFRGGLNR